MELPAAFGKYWLTDKIATGGMAEIYLAKLIGPGGFEKPLVIKQIRPELSGRPRFVEMFVAEAKTLVSLSHGNIVPIYELGMVGDTYFLAMDYIDGPSLGELQAAIAKAGKPFPVMTAAFIGAEILKGLDYAHRKGDGVIHRDLSPRNVLVSREGEVKIVDFGIAVTMAAGAEESQHAGLPEGSFPYMSPEQVRGEPLDARTDIFSAGVLLWELCTGENLFARDSAESTLLAVLEDDIPRLADKCADVPAALDEACARALCRDRDERFQTAAEFLAALGQCLYAARPPQTSASVGALVTAATVRKVRRDRAPEDKHPATPTGDDHGPSTRPIDRTRPQGESRPAPTKTFATHAAIERALKPPEPATPARPPRKAMLWALALVAAVSLVAGAAVMTPWSSSPGSPKPAAGSLGVDAGRGSSQAVAPGAIDAGQKSSLDARPRRARAQSPDAGQKSSPRVTPDTRRRPPPARVEPAATGTLKVGANPWADVYVDGKRLGRAPGSWEIAAGRHDIEVVFPVPGREDRRQFAIELAAGKTTSLGIVDFSP